MDLLSLYGSGSQRLPFHVPHESPEAAYYFLKLRAMCEFALEVPYNPDKIRRDMEELLARLSPSDLELLTRQFEKFQTAWEDYGQETVR